MHGQASATSLPARAGCPLHPVPAWIHTTLILRPVYTTVNHYDEENWALATPRVDVRLPVPLNTRFLLTVPS